MWVISSLCFSLVSILFSLSLHQGLASESGCRLVLSKNNQSLAVQIGSTGELICQISSECNLTGRILGPFWTLADKSWFVSNTRMFNTRINSTTISLRYAGIIHEDLGIYHCVVRIGRKMLSITANITERLGKEGDVFVTTSPDHETEPPRKKRYAVPFVGVGLVRAVPPRNYQRLARRSLQSKTKDSHHGNPSLTDYPARGGEDGRSQFQSRHIGTKVRYT